MIDVGQVVGGEVLPSGLPLLVRAAFDGETDRLDAILVIHPIYRLRKFEPLVTLADGVEQHGLYAAGNDVTDAFVRWAAPLIGEPLPRMVSFRNDI